VRNIISRNATLIFAKYSLPAAVRKPAWLVIDLKSPRNSIRVIKERYRRAQSFNREAVLPTLLRRRINLATKRILSAKGRKGAPDFIAPTSSS